MPNVGKKVVRSFTRTIVVRLMESERRDGTYDTFRGDDAGVDHRDPAQINLYDGVGFYFANVSIIVIDHGGGDTEEFTGERYADRSPIYWCPGSIVATTEELLERFPDDRELIIGASSSHKVAGLDRLVRVEVCPDDDDDSEPAEPFPAYLLCSQHDQVLPDSHGIELELVMGAGGGSPN
jgi:hypothetical protein